MSQTDLELCQDLPKIRVIQPQQQQQQQKHQVSPMMMIKQIQTPEPSEARFKLDLIVRRDEEQEQEQEQEQECRTPKSKEHRIPEMLTCPPAPRKPSRAPSCKRKLSELDFFEASNRDEVEDFFRSSFVVVKAKRNCCPCK